VTSFDDDSSLSSKGFQDLKKKSIAGMAALFVRQILVKVIFFIGNIILARILAPEIFGIYAIVNFVVTFFSTFGDVGIGAALIQKKGELSKEELSTTFWLQQMLVWSVVAIAIAAAPLALKVYPTLPPVGVWLIRAMALSFLLSSLKTIPAILMERSIDFKRIAWVDITENLAFQAVAISCAIMGLGAWSFVLAAIARALLGAVIIFALSPWRPSFHYRFESVKGLVTFGLPYQGNQVLCFLKDAVTPLFVGAYAGAAAVGYVNWARNLAFAPLLLSETFGRVAFPAFSRIQDDRELLARTIERSVRMMTIVMFPVTAIMAAAGPEITHLIFTNKWLPGIWAFYFYCTSPFLIGIMLPLYCAILSLGKSNVLLKMSGSLLILEWGIGIPCVIKFGFVGIAFSQPIVTGIFFQVYLGILRKESVEVCILRNIWSQLIAALSAAICIRLWLSKIDSTMISLASVTLAGVTFYIIFLFILNGKILVEFKEYINKIKG